MAPPIKCHDVDDIRGQLKLVGWLYNLSLFIPFFNEEAPLYKQYGRGGIILLLILKRRPHFIGLIFGGGWLSVFMSKNMLEVGLSLTLWSMFYLEGWSSRSSYFIGVA